MTRTQPKRLLLATDLSPRGDRALDRAVQLAREWRAELRLLNVLENDLLPPPQLRRDVAERLADATALLAPFVRRAGPKLVADVKVGDAASWVLDEARMKRAGLVVMAPARYDSVATAMLGSTVDRVLRHATQPVLVVKRRCAGAYRSILVAVDLSDTSAYALTVALRLFPDARFTVIHAYEIPFAGLMASGAIEVEVQGTHRRAMAALIETALKGLGRGTKGPKLKILVEQGSPDDVVFRHLRAEQPDLLVLGTHGITGVRRAVIGSTAERLTEIVPCDVLAVHPPI